MKRFALETHTVFPASCHVEPKGGRVDRIAPMSYFVVWLTPDRQERHLYGFGGERSTQVMLAHAILHAIQVIMREALSDALMTECVTEAVDFWKIPNETLINWRRKKKFAADGVETWLQLATLKELSNLKERIPNSATEGAFIGKARRKASALRSEALADFKINPLRYRTAGVYVMAEDMAPA